MRLQVTIDAADPHAQAEFWAQAIGYQVEDNSTFVDQLVTDGRLPDAGRLVRNGRSEFVDVTAARDPQGEGPRLFFQKVPEAKVGKTRVHIDVPVADERKADEVARLAALGARELYVTSDRGPVTHTMIDPEGNEFCLH